MIGDGAHGPTHTASMADMGAACIASAGTGLAHGHGRGDDDVPDRPRQREVPGRGGRGTKDTYGEIGLGAHWMKVMLHYLFIYKAKARPGWYLIPE